VTNNYIGVKVPSRLRGQGKGQMSGTHEEVNGKMIAINDEFMKFNTLEDMARHHIDLLSRNRYQAFSGSVDEFAQRVKNGGYATASNYVSALNGMINSVRNSGVQIAQKGGQIKPNIIQRLEDRKKFHNFRMTLPPNLRPLSRDYNMRRY
jgi:flagellum-specific peptidoglycan hydrolase FlgJ